MYLCVNISACFFDLVFPQKWSKWHPGTGAIKRLQSIGFRSSAYAVYWAKPKLVETPNFCRAAVLPPLGCVAGSFQTTLKNMSMWLLSLVPHMQPFESVQGNILQGLLTYLQNRTCGFNLSKVFTSERKSIEPIKSISIEHIVSVNVH